MKAKAWEKRYSTVLVSKSDPTDHHISVQYYAKITGAPSTDVLTQTRSYTNLVAAVVRSYAIRCWPATYSLLSVSVSPVSTLPAMFEQMSDQRIFQISVQVQHSDPWDTCHQTRGKRCILALPNRIAFAEFTATIRHILGATCSELSLFSGAATQPQPLKQLSRRTVSGRLSLLPETLSSSLALNGVRT